MFILRRLHKRLLAIYFFIEDAKQHFRFAAPDDRFLQRKISLASKITILEKDLHRVEKGLSLNKARQDFGLEVASRIRQIENEDLALDLEHYKERARIAIDSLVAWQFHQDRSLGLLTERVSPYISSDELVNMKVFFHSRRSIRNFNGKIPSKSEITNIFALSINTPSVCNRQSWKVWYVTNPEILKSILKLQNGNSGFENLNAILIFGADLRKFTLGTERNQVWIDGGLFAMTSIWALHAHGIGTCFLNWATSPRNSKKLRNYLDVGDYIEFISFCAVGYFDENSLTAKSPRREVSSYIEFVE